MNDTSNEKGNFSKNQKIIIISFLSVFVILLGVAAFVVSRQADNERLSLSDGSRTIMVYLVGSNLESQSKIVTYELDGIIPDEIDLDKTNILLYTGGTEKWHNFIQNDENAIYQLKSDGFEKFKSYKKLNMGDAKTLEEFLEYSYKNYKTEYYDLIFYDHGGAIDGAIYDDFTDDNLTLLEFKQALEKSPFNEKNRINTVLFRTCLNGTIEVATMFAPYANYLIASEEVTNGGGNTSVLKFVNDISVDDDETEYGKKFIKSYEEQMKILDPYGFSSMPMYSIIDLSKIDKVNDLLEEFISSVELEENYSKITKVRSNLYQYAYDMASDGDFDTVDLYELVSQLGKYSSKSNTDLLNAIDDAVIYNWSAQKKSNGLSIYFPYRGKKNVKENFLNVYQKFDRKEYFDFINRFYAQSTSNRNSSFSSFSASKHDINIDSNKEFSLQLTEEQQKDYAESIYIVFRKTNEGLYNPIYSSDNTSLSDDGKLSTNISNKLIKIYDLEKENDKGNYLTIIERNNHDQKFVTSSAILEDFSGENGNMNLVAVMAYFEEKDNEPNIVNYISKKSQNNALAGTMYDPADFQTIAFNSSHYNILDSNGKYIENWDNNGIIRGYEVHLDKAKYEYASLNDEDDFYCVFKIYDIYGNISYSELINIK